MSEFYEFDLRSNPGTLFTGRLWAVWEMRAWVSKTEAKQKTSLLLSGRPNKVYNMNLNKQLLIAHNRSAQQPTA